MFFNIAKNNIRRSFKDYTIYFLTLTFAVCIFYTFNSIGSQSAMSTLSESKKEYLIVLNNITSILSIFVSFILGALIIYANNFLIKRRKKELGIYTMLGMGKTKISRILVLETLIVGVISLIIGLIAGLIISQGLSVLTSKFFGGIITKMTFVISYNAIGKTILYFGIIFILVMIFNVTIVAKYKLIDLLIANKKNEKIKIKNPIILGIIFIFGSILLISGYTLILKNGLKSESILYISIALGSVGTFLFFYGLAGALVIISQKNKNRYLRGLNIFVTKQMNNKINTSFISMALISLMLFVTISALSTGVSLKNSISNSLKNNTPFTVSTSIMGTNENNINKDINNVKAIYGKDLNKLNTITLNNTYLNKPIQIIGNGEVFNHKYSNTIKLSDYNQYLKLIGKPTASLNNNQVLVTSNNTKNITKLKPILNQNAKLTFNGKHYDIKNKLVLTNTFENSPVPSNGLTIIVPDTFIINNKTMLDNSYVTLLSLAKNKIDSKEIQTNIDKNYANYNKAQSKLSSKERRESAFYMISTQQSLQEQSQGMVTIILFIAIYIGVIFLITSSAIIGLQQLVDATDSKERYDVLRKIGATNKMINKAILKQVCTAFMLPLGLAVIDSIVAIKAISSFVEAFGKSDITTPAIFTGIIIIIIYGGYMIATYFSFKNAVKEND